MVELKVTASAFITPRPYLSIKSGNKPLTGDRRHHRWEGARLRSGPHLRRTHVSPSSSRRQCPRYVLPQSGCTKLHDEKGTAVFKNGVREGLPSGLKQRAPANNNKKDPGEQQKKRPYPLGGKIGGRKIFEGKNGGSGEGGVRPLYFKTLCPGGKTWREKGPPRGGSQSLEKFLRGKMGVVGRGGSAHCISKPCVQGGKRGGKRDPPEGAHRV